MVLHTALAEQQLALSRTTPRHGLVTGIGQGAFLVVGTWAFPCQLAAVVETSPRHILFCSEGTTLSTPVKPWYDFTKLYFKYVIYGLNMSNIYT